ncbi:MAG: putative serine protease PepD [Frankiales bacterium]|nr:putative serine protease PepD [Frankiales bacterium]
MTDHDSREDSWPMWSSAAPTQTLPPPSIGDEYDDTHPTEVLGGTPPPWTGDVAQGTGGGGGRGRLLLGVVGVALVAAISGATGALVATRGDTPSTTNNVITGAATSVSGGTSPTEQLARVAAAVQPSVVSITVTTQGGGDEGSGVIVRSDGMVLTNNHVVEAAADGGGTISVKLSNGSTAAATIVGRDPSVDLAVIKMTGVSGLTVATLGSSAGLHVGDTVLAIGSPLGLDGSVSAGIVSALHRTVSLRDSQNTNPFGQQQSTQTASLGDAIQTDAAINPGNSGGALVDSTGHIVGINSAIATAGTNGNIGVGFAIPIDEAKSVMGQLINGQTPTHAVLGVNVTDAQTGDGALIQAVVAGSAAAKAGLQAGDVVTKIGDTAIDSSSALAAAVRAHQPGDKVLVHFLRGGTDRTLTITLASATS